MLNAPSKGYHELEKFDEHEDITSTSQDIDLKASKLFNCILKILACSNSVNTLEHFAMFLFQNKGITIMTTFFVQCHDKEVNFRSFTLKKIWNMRVL